MLIFEKVFGKPGLSPTVQEPFESRVDGGTNHGEQTLFYLRYRGCVSLICHRRSPRARGRSCQ